MIITTRNRAMATAMVLSMAAFPASSVYGVRAVEDSIEVAALYVSLGPPARVRAVGCPTCPRTFELAEDYRLIVDGEPLPHHRWLEQQGEVGTLIFNIESERAVRLRW
jgi:hypothetical protein